MCAVSLMCLLVLQSAGSVSDGAPCWFTPAHQGLSPAILTPLTDEATRVLPNKMDVFNPTSATGFTWYCPSDRAASAEAGSGAYASSCGHKRMLTFKERSFSHPPPDTHTHIHIRKSSTHPPHSERSQMGYSVNYVCSHMHKNSASLRPASKCVDKIKKVTRGSIRTCFSTACSLRA